MWKRSVRKTGTLKLLGKKPGIKSLVVGKEITILSPSGDRNATALDVDQDCHLIVQYENGQTERLSSGEISIRLS